MRLVSRANGMKPNPRFEDRTTDNLGARAGPQHATRTHNSNSTTPGERRGDRKRS